MQTFKIEDVQLTNAAKQLREANKQLAEAKKTADSAKEIIANRLATLRGITIEALPIGEIVSINAGFILIEIGSQNRLDTAKLEIDKPELFAQYKRNFPCVKYKVNL